MKYTNNIEEKKQASTAQLRRSLLHRYVEFFVTLPHRYRVYLTQLSIYEACTKAPHRSEVGWVIWPLSHWPKTLNPCTVHLCGQCKQKKNSWTQPTTVGFISKVRCQMSSMSAHLYTVQLGVQKMFNLQRSQKNVDCCCSSSHVAESLGPFQFWLHSTQYWLCIITMPFPSP